MFGRKPFSTFSKKWILLLFVSFASSHLCAGGIAGSSQSKTSSLVIITNWGQDNCSLVDIDTGKELAVIEVGLKPYDVKVEPTGRYAYVTLSGVNEIGVIDIQAMLLADRIVVGQSPRDIALTSDGKNAVVANAGDDSISFVDLESKKELYKVKVGSIPYGVALTENDTLAVVTNWGSNEVSLVKLGDNAGNVVRTFKVGALPYTAVITGKGDYALVTCFGSHQVFPINLREMEVLDPVDVGRSPWGIGVSSEGDKAVVANFYSGDASILEISRARLKKAHPVDETARISLVSRLKSGGGSTQRHAKNAALTSNGKIAVMSDLANNEIMIVDLETQNILRTVTVGKAPYGIAFVPRSSS